MITQVYFAKNTTGSLYLTLQDYEGIRPIRVFEFATNQQEVAIPFGYALFIFSNPHLRTFFKQGQIIPGRNWEEFKKELVKYDLLEEITVKEVLPEQTKVTTNGQKEVKALKTEEIAEILKKGDATKIGKLLDDEYLADEVVTIANRIEKELTRATIDLIQNKTKLPVGTDD